MTPTPQFIAPGEGDRLNVLGDNQTVKLAAEQTGGALTLTESTNPPDAGFPLHWRNREDTLLYVVSGAIEVTLGDRTVPAAAGTTVYIPRGVAHGWRTMGDGLSQTLIAILPGGAERMLRELAVLVGNDQHFVQALPPREAVAAVCAPYGVHFAERSEGLSQSSAIVL